VWARHRRLAQTAAALIIRCQVQNATGAVTVVADRMGRIDTAVGSKCRDFRSRLAARCRDERHRSSVNADGA